MYSLKTWKMEHVGGNDEVVSSICVETDCTECVSIVFAVDVAMLHYVSDY